MSAGSSNGAANCGPVPQADGGLRAADVHFAYRGRTVLAGASLALRAGEVLSLLGANGAGKSTLLRLLLGFIAPAGGSVEYDGRPLSAYGRRALAQRIAYVPQVHAMPFPYRVRDVVAMGRLPAAGLWRTPGPSDHETVDRVLASMGIAHLAERVYTEISGGERQLALIARALTQGARTLVMDEPATGLDYGHQMRLIERVRALAGEGYAVLMTTHHPEHALLASTRVALLADGRVEADGAPHEVVTPDSIHRMYGVHVCARQWGGHTAFFPADAANDQGARDVAPNGGRRLAFATDARTDFLSSRTQASQP